MSDPLLPNSNTQATQLWLPLLAAQFFAPCSSSSSFRTSAPASASTATEMEAQDDCKWRQVPAFGDWNLWDDMPVTQYFQAGTFFFAAPTTEKDDDEDLFKVPQFPATPYSYKKCVVRVKGEKGTAVPPAARKGGRRRRVNEQQKWKPKGAVDEDLYKISPQLLCKKKLLRNLLGGCLGLSCIA
ncbi:uncharacterized protein [Zea mays]|uniref:uncharacterized protein isoform X2 n=1 Tax=Zea mays TaxID=4577 RepID=UPI0007EE7CAE|nr:uncharacterized protein LOC118473165 isoform X2 [Zea mays]